MEGQAIRFRTALLVFFFLVHVAPPSLVARIVPDGAVPVALAAM
jgi:hypothetical protein